MTTTYDIAWPGKIVATSNEWMPHIDWLNPPDERDEARNLSLQISMLHNQEEQFKSAVELLQHVHAQIAVMTASVLPQHGLSERARVAQWMNIAGTYGAVCISNFRDAIFAIRHAVGQCPSRKGMVDTRALDAMPARFVQEFPWHKEIRDGAVHFVDKVFSSKKVNDNRAPDAPFIHGTMMGDTLVFTVDGRQVGLDVSIVTLEKLAALRREVNECFRRLSAR